VALGLATTRASGAGTTTTGTTTTTAATTTAATPSYAGLATSSLPTSCVGAGAAAVVPPSHAVIAAGTPASSLGPSGYPGSGSVVGFGSSSVSGSGCAGTTVTLTSVSLFGGAVTAASVAATGGRGTVSGLEIDGAAVSLGAGQAIAVDGWGLLTLGDSFGRLTAPLVLLLTQAHDGLLAGTRIAVAFAAAPKPVVKPRASRQASPSSRSGPGTPAKPGASGAKGTERHAAKAPPDFPASTNPFMVSGRLPDGARDNPVVSTAMRYLGVHYQWGGASPQTGFDCSGLVTYVFGQLGVSLPHYAAAQWYSPDTVWVSPHHLQAGDLVFFTGADGTRKAPGHVGIYIGDGYLIDAPHTGSFVQIDSLNDSWFANEYVGARRIVSQLLDTRRRPHLPESGASAGGILLDFPSPLRLDPLGESLQVAAAAPAASLASRASLTWGGSVLGGLLVLLMAGGLLFRRRRRPAIEI